MGSLEVPTDQSSGRYPATNQLPCLAALLWNKMLSGDKRLSFYSDADASRIVTNSTEVSACGGIKGKSRKPGVRGRGNIRIWMDRVWDLCSLLYRCERCLYSIQMELGLKNKDSVKKAMSRFMKHCEGMEITVIKRTPCMEDRPNEMFTTTYEVISADWMDRCLKTLKEISGIRSTKS